MYLHQEHCIAQLQDYEIDVFQNKYNSTVDSSASNNASKHFDYVLSLREDIYFFRPLILRTVIDQYLLNPRATALQESVGKGQKQDVYKHIKILRACDVPVDLFPVTAARNLPGGKYCFISFEIMHECIPQGMHEEINALDCQKIREPSNSNKGKI
eukprot:gene15731-11258_t